MIFNVEKKNRLRLLVATYCYEILDSPIIEDNSWDELAKSIQLDVYTDRLDMDMWFREHFKPYTGQWIHRLPDREWSRLGQICSSITDIKSE